MRPARESSRAVRGFRRPVRESGGPLRSSWRPVRREASKERERFDLIYIVH